MLRDIVAFAGLGMGVCIPSSSHADDTAKPEQRYEEAIDLLKRGRWLNLCATKLKDLSASSPQDVRYKIALGHTYASQCASLCYSLGSIPKTPATDEEIQRHDDASRAALAAKKSGQAVNPDALAGESPKAPAKPVPSGIYSFVTIDDGKSVTMTQEEFVAKLRRGFEDASSCWKAAVESSVGDEQKCSSLEAQIWGLQLFQFLASYSVSRAVPVAFSKEERGKWEEEAKKLAEQLVQIAPDNAQYRVLLAEVTLQPYMNAWNQANESKLALFEKAIKLGANDPAVRFRAYQICIYMTPQKLDEAGRLIREIAAEQHGNAYAQHRLAGYIAQYEMSGKQVNQNDPEKTREAMTKLVSVVTSGTLLTTYKPFDNCVSPPSLLKVPFAQVGGQAGMGEEMDGSTIGLVLTRYAKSTAERDIFFAKRCCYATLSMGKRLITPLPSADEAMSNMEPSQEIREMAGEIMLSQGYDALSEILRTKGDESEYNKIVNEQKDFVVYKQQRHTERIKQRLGHR